MTLRTPYLNAVLVTLAGAYVVVAFAFGVASLIGSPVSVPADNRAAQQAIAALGEVEKVPVDFAPLRQRPVFTISRRSKSGEAPAAGPPSGGSPSGVEDFKVVAIAIDGGMAFAALESSAAESVRVKVGSDVRGWVVTNIDKSGVTFVLGDEERRIDLAKPGSVSEGDAIRLGQGTPEQPEEGAPQQVEESAPEQRPEPPAQP